MSRALDLVLAAAALVILSPLLLVVTLLISVTSPGPPFFRQQRIGRNFVPFTLVKFRTMRGAAGGDGGMDFSGARVTPVGRLLRRAKLDELPQLWNVLRGDMSFVGPRPELAAYVERFRDDYQELLQVRPGLTDPATLAFRHEEELLRGSADPERTYVQEIAPQKIRLAREYLRRRTLASDLMMIARTIGVIVRSLLSGR